MKPEQKKIACIEAVMQMSTKPCMLVMNFGRRTVLVVDSCMLLKNHSRIISYI